MLAELPALIFLALAGAGVGAMLSSPLMGLFAGIGVWGGWQLMRLLRLRRWLDAGTTTASTALESAGLWGDVYRRIVRLRQVGAEDGSHRRRVHLEEGVAALPYGFVIIARDRRIDWFNAAAAELLRLTHPGDIGRDIGYLVRQPDFTAALENVEGGVEGGGEDSVEIGLNISGKSLAVYISLFDKDGDRLIVVQDLSRVRYLERARSELLGNVAHELKTPLTVINGYAEIIAGNLPADAKTADAVSHIRKQGERMNRIIDDLLMLERLEGGRLSANKSERVNLRGLADEVAEEAGVIGAGDDRRHIEIAVAEDAVVCGDRGELHSVLSNLVGNAVRYSPAGGVVRVSWSQDESGGRLAVSDEGPGIDPVHLPRLTERFYRADRNRSRESGGTGLGLAIVKRVLQRHDAVLRIESKPGKGSVFRCEFPAERLRAVSQSAR